MKTGLTILLCLSVAAIAFSQTNDASNLTPQAVAQKSLDTYAALTSYSDTGKSVESKAGQTNVTTFSIRMQRPNLFKIHWSQTGGDHTNEGIWWADGHPLFSADNTYLLTNAVGQPRSDQTDYIWMPLAVTSVFEVSGQATIIPEMFLKMDPGGNGILSYVAAIKSNSVWRQTELTEEKLGDVDCYVIAVVQKARNVPPIHIGKSLTRLWIGKQDYLLHQIQRTSEAPDMGMTQIHENISVNQPYPAADFQEQLPKKNSSITLHSSPPATAP